MSGRVDEAGRRALALGKVAYGTVANAARVAGKKLRPPALPVRSDGQLHVHLGCGAIDMPGFVNVDVAPLPHIHYVSSVLRLPMFRDGSADLVYACHVLEHISHPRVDATLAEWRRIVKQGGVLRLSVPDFDLLLAMREKEGGDVDAILNPLLGGQRGRLNFHYAVFTAASLTRRLHVAGFHDVRTWEPRALGYDRYGDWSSRSVQGSHGSHVISLNLEATA
jgi:SAM-dependent methyltransferase